MSKDVRFVAKQFAVYNQVGWYYQWEFCRALKWVSSDTTSLELLLDFEKKSEENSWTTFSIILNALRWYNREYYDDRLQDRLPHKRSSEMLQIVIVLLNKSQKIHANYRDLILNILYSGDKVRKDSKADIMITPEQFRLEATELISDLIGNWSNWHPHLESNGNLLLKCLVNIACKTRDPQLFTRFRLESTKLFPSQGWSALSYLGEIAGKVHNLQSFSEISNNVVPIIGLETTSSLMAISRDFEEFKICYPRIIEQVELWGSNYTYLFRRTDNIAKLNQLLIFLETLPKTIRMTRYILYTQTHCTGTLLTHISGALRSQKRYVFEACSKHNWNEVQDTDRFIETQINHFEQTIVDTYLDTIWRSSIIASRRIRWEFDKFTEYIPYAMTSWNWTTDDEKSRPYWNSREAAGQEYRRYISELEPRLLSLLRVMDLPEIETLFDLLPGYLSIEVFTKIVKVPVIWERDRIVQEGYQKWVGFYDEEIEIARPTGFIEHTFTFERPSLQAAIYLLDDTDRIHEAIRKHKNSRHQINL